MSYDLVIRCETIVDGPAGALRRPLVRVRSAVMMRHQRASGRRYWATRQGSTAGVARAGEDLARVHQHYGREAKLLSDKRIHS